MKNNSTSIKKRATKQTSGQAPEAACRLTSDQAASNNNVTAANDAVQNTTESDLAQVQEILFGDSSRNFERKLLQLNEQFSASIKALQDTFSNSVTAIREEAISAAQQHQLLLSKNSDRLSTQIERSNAQLDEDRLRSEQKTATEIEAMRTDFGNRLLHHSNAARHAETALQENKVDRGELAMILEQLAKVIRTGYNVHENSNSQVTETRKR